MLTFRHFTHISSVNQYASCTIFRRTIIDKSNKHRKIWAKPSRFSMTGQIKCHLQFCRDFQIYLLIFNRLIKLFLLTRSLKRDFHFVNKYLIVQSYHFPVVLLLTGNLWSKNSNCVNPSLFDPMKILRN